MARAREEINTMKIDAHFILNYFEFMSIILSTELFVGVCRGWLVVFTSL